MDEQTEDTGVVELTADIVSAYVSNNTLVAADLPALIADVNAALGQAAAFAAGPVKEELTPAVSQEKRLAIEDYFWMLEEYKVSVFAQELKTAIPISAKRLKDKLKQIERMI